MDKNSVKPSEGKLGILCVGLGAVSSTFITGVLMIRKGMGKPIGSITQMAKIRVGRGDKAEYKHVSEIVPMPALDDIVFGAWDILPDNAFESAMHAEVLKDRDIYPVKEELEKIVPMRGIYDQDYVKAIDGTWTKDTTLTRWQLMEQAREDIRNFKEKNGCSRIVVIWAASTEIYIPRDKNVHDDLTAFEAAMKADDRQHISPSMCYAYAAIAEGACDPDVIDRLTGLLEACGLMTTSPYSAEELFACALHDKKRHGDSIDLVIPRRIGACSIENVSLDAFRILIEEGLAS